jgi:hypothetical protein
VLKLVLLLLSKRAFLRHREPLMAASEVGKNLLIVLGAWGVIPLALPAAALGSIYRSRADVVIFGLIRPLLQHLRWRLHLLLVALEAATMPWLFAQVAPSWTQVLRRFAASFGLSLLVGALNDSYARRQFVRHHRRVSGQEQQHHGPRK